MKYAIEVSVNKSFIGFFNKYYLGQEKREKVFYDLENEETKQNIESRIYDTIKSFPGQTVSFAFVEESLKEKNDTTDDFQEDFEDD